MQMKTCFNQYICQTISSQGFCLKNLVILNNG